MLITRWTGISALTGPRARRWARMLLPSQCAICHRWPAASRICTDCRRRFLAPQPRCRTCALAIASGTEQCGECLLHPPALKRCIAAVSYAYPWAGQIAQFKFTPDPGWAATLAELMLQAHGAHQLIEDADIVLPIALSRERLAERGFNQALLLARHAIPAEKIQHNTLLRVRHTAAQSGLTRAQRLRNLRQSFAVEPIAAAGLIERRVLLIDDVLTTGATLEAAARCVQQAGAREVAALVLARTE